MRCGVVALAAMLVVMFGCGPSGPAESASRRHRAAGAHEWDVRS